MEFSVPVQKDMGAAGGLKSEVQHHPCKVCTWKNKRSAGSSNPRTA